MRRQSANWLYLANQIPGCLTPARCKTGHWVRPEDIAGTSRMCRPCRRAKVKAQRAKNPHLGKARHKRAKHRRRARERGADGDCTPEQWESILKDWGHACAHCSTTGVEMTQDHIIPLSKGGSNDWTNYQPLCHPCNSRKSDTITGTVQAMIPGLLTHLHQSSM
jgi:5-methylcytosine-specific restriction endonuclease McrA